MIDYVSLYTEINIPEQNLSSMCWTCTGNKFNRYYMKSNKSIKFFYYPDSQRFVIQGKLATIFHYSQVLNVDDVYGRDLSKLITDCNRILTSLTSTPIDIGAFTPARIDFCFNIKTPYVNEYLDFMSNAFNSIGASQRKNYTEEFDESGSVYVKTSSDFAKNTRDNYVLNFYDKSDWIADQRRKNIYVSQDDENLAKDVLRLEVQVTNNVLKKIAQEREFGLRFDNFLSYDIAYEVIELVYNRVFKAGCEQSYYKYDSAKKLFSYGSSALHVLELSAEHHKITGDKYRYGVNMIKKNGVYPYAFLPKDLPINWLPSPLSLIKEKIEML